MDQARKALYCVYRKFRNISIPIDLQFKLFDTLILPILTNGSEIWGYANTKQLEKLHRQFCRNILGVRIINMLTFHFTRMQRWGSKIWQRDRKIPPPAAARN